MKKIMTAIIVVALLASVLPLALNQGVAMALPPQLKADFVVKPAPIVCVGQQFVLKANVTNIGTVGAHNVTVRLVIFPAAGAAITAGAKEQSWPFLGVGQIFQATWTVECKAKGIVTFRAVPGGEDDQGNPLPVTLGITTHDQTKPHLTATIKAPSSVKVGEEFTVSAWVKNTGKGTATDVSVKLSWTGGVSLVSIHNPYLLGTLVPNQSKGPVTWTLRCDNKSRTTFTATPAGKVCDGPQIPPADITPASTPSLQCFIATAAYGTSTAEELDTLRDFRDEVLLESTLGSQLVEWYYQTSPPVADFISEHEGLRTLVREVLVEPVVWLVDAIGSLWRN